MSLPHPAVRFGTASSVFALVALLMGPTPAHSHALESSLERLSSLTDQLVLDSRFGNGEPADDAIVRLVPPGGTPIEVGRTDANGQLRFQLPPSATAAWEVQIDKGPGHRDYLELPGASPTTSSRPAGWQPLAFSTGGGVLGGGVLGVGILIGSLAWRRRRSENR